MATAKPDIRDADLVDNSEAALTEKKDSHSSEPNEQREAPADAANTHDDRQFYEKYGTHDRYELTEEDCYDELGFSFPTWKKWTILSVVFLVQVSMNFNTSLYSNAVPGISEEFNVSQQAARVGAAIFLLTYAFGCELWAPWSEELGRWPVLQLSMFLVNIWQIPVGIAPNFATILVCRALGGLSTAGGSVTLAMVADMWQADEQQYAVVCSSCVLGSSLQSKANNRVRPSLFSLLSVVLSWVPLSVDSLSSFLPGVGTSGSS
jgi:MFS family permease